MSTSDDDATRAASRDLAAEGMIDGRAAPAAWERYSRSRNGKPGPAGSTATSCRATC